MKLLLVFKRIIFSEWYTEQVETQHSGQSDHGTHCLQKVFVFLILFSNSYNMDHIMQIGAGSVHCAHTRKRKSLKKFDHPCIRPVQLTTWAPGLLFASELGASGLMRPRTRPEDNIFGLSPSSDAPMHHAFC